MTAGAGYRRFGVFAAAAVESDGVDNGDVRALPGCQAPGVEAVPVGQLTGHPAHRGLDRHESR